MSLKEFRTIPMSQKERQLKECTLYYESWQLQCCGEVFAVGDTVNWTCYIPDTPKDAHGISIDFEENHHDMSTHSISGTITKIIAERSELPPSNDTIYYEKVTTIHEEMLQVEGWEKEYSSDDNTRRTLWGYILTLKNVVVKPIYRKPFMSNK